MIRTFLAAAAAHTTPRHSPSRLNWIKKCSCRELKLAAPCLLIPKWDCRDFCFDSPQHIVRDVLSSHEFYFNYYGWMQAAAAATVVLLLLLVVAWGR